LKARNLAPIMSEPSVPSVEFSDAVPDRGDPVPIARAGNGWAAMFSRIAQSLLRRSARKIPYRSPPFWRGQLLAVLCAAAGTGVRLLLQPVVQNHLPVILFYPFVLVAAVWGGTLSGLTTLVLGAMIADVLWLPPMGSFRVNVDSATTLIAFGIVCLFGIFVARLLRALVEVHVESEERAILFSHEIRHRANNLLGVVQAISAQTARNATSVADHQAVFSNRIQALARAQQLLSDHLEEPPDLRAFLLNVIEPFGIARFQIEGPTIKVPLYLGPSCALLLHELSTNATKYGALSVPDGFVSILWRTENNRVDLEWRELNGPPVAPPVRTGFGSRLLKTAFPAEYGNASIAFEPDGVRCSLRFALL
jgi:two-component sensor histidine kinase